VARRSHHPANWGGYRPGAGRNHSPDKYAKHLARHAIALAASLSDNILEQQPEITLPQLKSVSGIDVVDGVFVDYV